MQFRDLKSQYRALKPQMDEAIQAVLILLIILQEIR